LSVDQEYRTAERFFKVQPENSVHFELLGTGGNDALIVLEAAADERVREPRKPGRIISLVIGGRRDVGRFLLAFLGAVCHSG
jgi:hypothetical protein